MNRQNQAGKTIYEAQVKVNTLYVSEDGALCAAVFGIPVSFQKEVSEGFVCTCGCRTEGDIMVVPVTGGFEVRLEVEFCWRITKMESIPMVSSVHQIAADPDQKPRPSVTIRMVNAGEELWDIAKSCSSTIENICAANDLQTETPPVGTLLLIPTNR